MPRLPLSTYLLWVLAFALPLSGLSQGAGQYIAEAKKELDDGFSDAAIFYLDKALELDTVILEAHMLKGDAYRMNRNYRKAARSYAQVTEYDAQDEYIEAFAWLATMQMQMGKYKRAKLNYQTFLSYYKKRDELYRMARDYQINCDWALEHESDTAKYELIDLDSGINSNHSEMSPLVLNDSTMYFASVRYESMEFNKRKPQYVELEKAIKVDDHWELDEFDIPIADPEQHVGNASFNADRSQLYYSKCEELNACKIYRIKRENMVWSEPELLPDPINTEGTSSTQPTITKAGDKEYLIFSSDRETGKGGMDIWFVEIKDNEPTTRIRNMGTRVNTKGDEITPFYSSDDSTLYFSSNRHNGFGGFDILMAKGIPGSIDAPQNLGTEINTPADDYYLVMNKVDSVGYFASNRKGGEKSDSAETCCNDIYHFKIVPEPEEPEEDSLDIDSVATDTAQLVTTTFEETAPETIEELQNYLPISLYFHNDRPDPRTMSRTTERTYIETVDEYIDTHVEYLAAANASEMDADAKMEFGNGLKEFFNKDLKYSVSRLNKTLDIMLIELADSSILQLAIKGYASPLANSEYNLNLTYRRIQSLENYLRVYNDGAFVPYLESGQLTIEKIPYGESQSSGDASDAATDRLNAVYSPAAVQERRIEILRLEKG